MYLPRIRGSIRINKGENMEKKHRRIINFFISAILFVTASCPVTCFAETEPAAVRLPPEVSARNAIVIELATGKILYEKNCKEKAYPASITKIMTALLTIEAGDLDRKVRVPEAAAGIEGSSIYLAAREVISLRDLVYGLMLRSGNDAAVALSCLAAPSTPEFVQNMNDRARELGAADTSFVNPSGLFDENHYTTAYDMALIAREAMRNEDFRAVVGAKSWVANRGEGKYNYFYNKNKVVFEYQGGSGIKIGYTKRSGRTLAASSERDGLELICVVMNAPDWFNDSYKLMDYVFGCFENEKVFEGQLRLKAIPARGGDKDHIFVGLKEQVYIPVLKGAEAKVEIIYRLPAYAAPPVRRWQKAGTMELYLEGNYLSSYPLYYLEDIDPFVPRYR